MGFRAGDSTLYRYVHNNPMNATDPSGLVDLPIPGKDQVDKVQLYFPRFR
jgi:hypothetical protein